MISQLSLLFSITITHTYYEGGICKELQYKPSVATQNLLNKYNVHIHKTTTGFSLYASIDNNIKDFLNTIKTTEVETSFSFEVVSLNPSFTAYTLYPNSEIGYLSFTIPTNGDTTTLERTFVPDVTSTISFKITIDFDAIIRFRESGNSPNYTVTFESRKTQWRYYIITNSRQQFEKLSIQSNSDIQFEGPTETMLQNGQNALMFSSGSLLLPLTEIPEYSFDLLSISENPGTPDKVIFKGLPIASPNNLKINTERGTIHVVSPLYVYI
ncbi:hypothetical protein [uncultured Dokdonia sp.]|uniref:hypothetical protein n=1 Tax=uncultured Dokdonia sp. TaxID=575653 RepID=UPI0026213A3D|nr:hypothetical protein [uncultured Dokdonia sp.]